MSNPTLSVLIPVYNEIGTIGAVVTLLQQVLPSVTKELVIVDDGSTDGTRSWLEQRFSAIRSERDLLVADPAALAGVVLNDHCAVRVVFHERNKGKGGAVQTAMKACTGGVIVIQDADLEYDPADWETMYDLIVRRKVADVVYGSRFYGRPHRSLYYHHYIANRLISHIYNILFNQTLTDIEVCYKMFTRKVLDSLAITCNDFGFEVQISAQIARARRWRIYEVGIQYFGRSYDEGKKINWKDGLKALWYLAKFRLVN